MYGLAKLHEIYVMLSVKKVFCGFNKVNKYLVVLVNICNQRQGIVLSKLLKL